MRFSSVILALVLALASTAFAAEIAPANQPPNAVAAQCSLAGTWYGGSDPAYPYLLTITSTGGNRYTFYGEAGADNLAFGYEAWTGWFGEVIRTDAGGYDWWGLSYWVWDPDAAIAAGVDGSLPELDIVHSTLDLTDCNTMTSTIDTYAAYFTFNSAERSPFIDTPDLDFLGVMGITTLVETYHRMPRWSDVSTKRIPEHPTIQKATPNVSRRR